MKNKQTTIEWLEEQIKWRTDVSDIIEQAKEMEMQQIIKSAASAYEDMFGSDGTKYGEEYYNNTFKNK
jgi:hypothetical protein